MVARPSRRRPRDNQNRDGSTLESAQTWYFKTKVGLSSHPIILENISNNYTSIVEYHCLSGGSLPWNASQVGPIIGQLAPQFLFQHYCCTFCSRTDCLWKVLCLGFCSHHVIRSFTWLEQVVISDFLTPIATSLRQGHPHRLHGVYIVLCFYLIPEIAHTH